MHSRAKDKGYRSVCTRTPRAKDTDRYVLAREQRGRPDRCLRTEEKSMDWYVLAH